MARPHPLSLKSPKSSQSIKRFLDKFLESFGFRADFSPQRLPWQRSPKNAVITTELQLTTIFLYNRACSRLEMKVMSIFPVRDWQSCFTFRTVSHFFASGGDGIICCTGICSLTKQGSPGGNRVAE